MDMNDAWGTKEFEVLEQGTQSRWSNIRCQPYMH